MQPAGTPDTLDLTHKELDTAFTQPVRTSDQPSATLNRPNATNAAPNRPNATSDVAPGPIATTALVPPERLPNSPQNCVSIRGTGSGLPPNVLANIANEPVWMKRKELLKYLRSTPKLGDLSDVINHWYELESLLGFPEAVSFRGWLVLQYAHDLQTPLGFPGDKHPPVIRVFHKYGHNYKKKYGVKVHTLGRQTMEWWSEICPPDGVPNVRFGGTTGIYTIVVLLSWWCTLLAASPDEERTDLFLMLGDVNRVFVAAIDEIRGHPTTSDPMSLSLVPPPPPPRPRKRANPGGTSPQKRKRRARA
jgi:hypothetical protein